MSEFILSNDSPALCLEIEEAFNALEEKEKLYAHYLSKGAWYGYLINVLHVSPESPLLFSLMFKLFSLQSVEDFKNEAIQQNIASEEEIQAFLIYASGIFFHFGNYLSFGSQKFIPNLPRDKFEALLLSSQFARQNPEYLQSLLSRCIEKIYSLKDNELRLGYPDKGVTTFLSKNVTEEDIVVVNKFLKEKNLEVWNTRLFKTTDEAGRTCYEIRMASILGQDDDEDKSILSSTIVNGCRFEVTRGDFSKILSHLCKYLKVAMNYVSNENQKNIIEKYLHSFLTGSINSHKDASRFWIKDKSPVVESQFGFIETYNDPAGMRSDFVGFVALVNKVTSAKFAELVKLAEKFIALLPWPEAYEKDKFLKPDFTSIEVLTVTGCVFSGWCIPNYNEIRQTEGFKNLSFGNIIQSKLGSTKKMNFLSDADSKLMKKYVVKSFEVSVGLHELLGHGCGKDFYENEDGTFNFDIDSVIDYETNNKVTSWYKPGESWSSVFGKVNNAYEECRADSVAVYLCTIPEILKIFELEGEAAEDVMYANWLYFAYRGLCSIEVYDIKTDTWHQAHAQGRFAILQVMLEAGEDFVKIEELTGEDGKPDLLITLDRSKILSAGKKSMGEFLKKLQLYKSTANVSAGSEFFKKYTSLKTRNFKYPFIEYRDIILARKCPDPFIILANTHLEEEKVTVKTYDSSLKGLIESFMDRFRDIDVGGLLEDSWKENKEHFC